MPDVALRLILIVHLIQNQLEGAWIRFSPMTKSSETKTCQPHPCLDPNTKETKIKLMSILLSSKPSNPELARVKGEELNEERED